MFDRIFGWRKASKCKKLMQMVQCRLKLLKNKRCCIAKQLREDVSQLLKHGHTQIAFQRAEQIILDESMIQTYDLLHQFCQFLIFHLPYIRRHRDCPNDINEAASTLVFSSARFGDLPELIRIRKLFGERYGHRFVITAVELRPGNLVNTRLKDNLCIKIVDDLKYQLLAEINSSLIKQAPLFLEYQPEADCEVQERVVRDAVKYIDSGRDLSLYEMDSCSEMIYFDHIEELVSPSTKHESIQDQRLFLFKSFGMVPLKNETAYYDVDVGIEDRKATEEKLVSRSISPCPHIHPKLPDYEEIAAKFKALKNEKLRIEN